ncbi:MAG: NAD(P)/FAD-dependent oxidoreductase [Herbiconiux sp.]|nr:MAG: NAD(P)/FAD-dependent oxidoreductase [Herbiconiux sp.]
MGARLAREGHRSFVILERASEVGGTWRDNRYPGVACDVPAHLYSYSFRQKADWSRLFAPGGEILDYLRATVADEGLEPHLRLGTEVRSVEWADGAWSIDTRRGRYVARSVVVAAGRLAEPVADPVDGFTGTAFHSARWPEGLDLRGARVGVVGTGSSAAQIIPQVAAEAEQLVVFQRTPAWVIPRDDRAYTPDEIDAFDRDPVALRQYRDDLFAAAERGFDARTIATEAHAALHALANAHRDSQVPDAGLREILTPDYEIGCKRVVISDDYFPAFARPNVTLEPSALESASGRRVRAASGASYELDVLVFATGFTASRPPYAAMVVGRDGETLAEHWRDGMRAYASTVVHGFPNLFVLNGPNATLGHNSAIHVIESQIGYVAGALAHGASTGSTIEVSAEAEHRYVEEIDRRAATTVWTTGRCSSWYLDPVSRRLALIWPGTAASFRQQNGTFDPAPFEESLLRR